MKKSNEIIKNILGKSFLLGSFLAMPLQMRGSLPSNGLYGKVLPLAMESEKNKANQKREINDVRYILANKEDFEEKICPPFKSLGEKVLIEKLLQEATEAEIAFSTPKENEEEFLKYFFGNPIKNKEERREFFETLTAKIEKKGIASTKLKSLDDQEQKEVTSYVASLIRVSPLTQAIQKSWLDQNVFNDQQIYDILARHAYSKNWDLVISLGEKNPAQLKKILGNVPSIASGYLSLLEQAFSQGNLAMMEVLLKNGANANKNISNNSAGKLLHLAIEGGNYEIVKLLLAHEADVNAVDFYRQTPLHLAVEKKHLEIVKLLLRYRAKVNEKDHCGKTPLHLAIKGGNYEVVKLLLKNGAKVEERDHGGKTPLHLAIEGGNYEVVELLLRCRAKVNEKDHCDRTPLHLAVEGGNCEIVKLLLSCKACKKNIDATSSNGRTSLYLAVEKKHLEIVKLLLDRGANIDATNSSGRTPLHLAVTRGCYEILKLLLDREAKINEKDHWSKTPLALAQQNWDNPNDAEKIREKLRECGATF